MLIYFWIKDQKVKDELETYDFLFISLFLRRRRLFLAVSEAPSCVIISDSSHFLSALFVFSSFTLFCGVSVFFRNSMVQIWGSQFRSGLCLMLSVLLRSVRCLLCLVVFSLLRWSYLRVCGVWGIKLSLIGFSLPVWREFWELMTPMTHIWVMVMYLIYGSLWSDDFVDFVDFVDYFNLPPCFNGILFFLSI